MVKEINCTKLMIDTIIFDMDGVIIDSEPLNLDILEDLYHVVGIDVPKKEHLSSLGVASKDWWTFLQNKYQFTNYNIEEMMKREREEVDNYIFSERCKEKIFPGVTEAVKKLNEKGFKLGIASASAYPVINQVLKSAGLDDSFDLILSATDNEIKKGKPEPDIFLAAADKLNASPDNCLVIEDSEMGLQAAKAAGMKTLGFLSAPKPINTENADKTFENYDEFLKIVQSFI